MSTITKVCFLFAICVAACKGNNCEYELTCLMTDPVSGLLLKSTKNCVSSASAVQYWLYTPNRVVQLQPGDSIDSNNPVNILIHGWGGNRNVDYIQAIKDAYLERYGWNHTVILVDYGTYAAGSGVSGYADARCNVRSVGANVASFICDLSNSNELDTKDIHVIGHSLGAHVAGVAGWDLQKNCKKTLGRITGLDPANPGFLCQHCKDHRLDSSDATFVEVIHTDAFIYGTPLNSGHVDFYVNHGGPYQPGCFDHLPKLTTIANDPFIIAKMPISCSHQRSCYYFAESIVSNSFLATSCGLGGLSVSACVNTDKVYMGEYCNKPQTYNTYYVRAKSSVPYGYGPNGPLS